MKQLILTLALLLAGNMVWAQNSAVTTAIMRFKQQKLIDAQEKIDMAIDHEKTKDDAKTWYYRGRVYQALASSENPQHQKAAGNDALVTAYNSYKKAIELDPKHREYYGKSKQQLGNLYASAINNGIKSYRKGKSKLEAGDNEAALSQFSGAVKNYNIASKLEPDSTTPRVYSIYSLTAIRNQGLAEGEDLKPFYEDFKKDVNGLIDLNAAKPEMIMEGIIFANKMNNKKEKLYWIKKGRDQFPSNSDIMIQEVDYYLRAGKVDVLEDKLKEGLKIDPDNVQLIVALGDLYNQQAKKLNKEGKEKKAKKKLEMATDQYKKALKKEPGHLGANFNLGVIFYNQGAAITTQVNNMDFNEYQKEGGKDLEKKAKEKYRTALDYLEKAYEADPKDPQVLRSLRNTYNHLNMTEKKEKIMEELKAVGG